MPLKSLFELYNILIADETSGIAPDGYSPVNVSYAIVISTSGELKTLLPLFDTVPDKKTTREVPKKMILPNAEIRSSGIRPNFLWDTSAYTLGLSNKDGEEGKRKSYSMDRFKAFKRHNLEILNNANSPAANAMRAFLLNFNPESSPKHPAILRDQENILAATGFFVFKIDELGIYAHEDPHLKSIWEKYYFMVEEEAETQLCMVTGEVGPYARIHEKVKGVRGAQSTGASLVGFNLDSAESHGKKQGENAPISRNVASGYITALNYLLASKEPKRNLLIGDTTVVYWSDKPAIIYADIFSLMFSDEQTPENEITDVAANSGQMEMFTPVTPIDPKPIRRTINKNRLAERIAEKIKNGFPVDSTELTNSLEADTRFFVLGLAPNSARISIRFFYKDLFTNLMRKVSKHYKDTRIGLANGLHSDPIPLWRLEAETVSKHVKEKRASPLLAGSLMRSILDDLPYPAALYNAIITRVRADTDDEKKGIKKINVTRAAIIKAYLTRKTCHIPNHPYKEVLQMTLNENSTNKAYLMGRLFAILEKAQENASGGNLNATIKDRYFTTACAAPASVFPVLLRLSQHHISKDDKYGKSSEWKIRTVMGKLEVEDEPFPRHLNLDEQGIFILGYYHQREDFFTKRTGNSEAETNPELEIISNKE